MLTNKERKRRGSEEEKAIRFYEYKERKRGMK